MSSNTTTPSGAARAPKPAPIPALIPVPDSDSPLFWAVIALNDDAEVQALQALRSAWAKKTKTAANHTTRIALIGAKYSADANTTYAFQEARHAGVLLYAWRGSKALVQSLPASLLAKHSATTHTATPAQQVAA